MTTATITLICMLDKKESSNMRLLILNVKNHCVYQFSFIIKFLYDYASKVVLQAFLK